MDKAGKHAKKPNTKGMGSISEQSDSASAAESMDKPQQSVDISPTGSKQGSVSPRGSSRPQSGKKKGRLDSANG